MGLGSAATGLPPMRRRSRSTRPRALLPTEGARGCAQRRARQTLRDPRGAVAAAEQGRSDERVKAAANATEPFDFLITADGYIRATTGFVKPGYLQEVSDTVQAWAPRGIQECGRPSWRSCCAQRRRAPGAAGTRGPATRASAQRFVRRWWRGRRLTRSLVGLRHALARARAAQADRRAWLARQLGCAGRRRRRAVLRRFARSWLDAPMGCSAWKCVRESGAFLQATHRHLGSGCSGGRDGRRLRATTGLADALDGRGRCARADHAAGSRKDHDRSRPRSCSHERAGWLTAPGSGRPPRPRPAGGRRDRRGRRPPPRSSSCGTGARGPRPPRRRRRGRGGAA